MIVNTVMRLPAGPPVAKVEATVEGRTYDTPATAPKFADAVLNVGDVSVSQATGLITAEATISNPSDQQIPGVIIGAACFDSAGTIVGGGPAALLGAMAPGGRGRAQAYITAASVPDHCEMTAQPSQF